MDAPLEYNPPAKPRACMILMHGLGADGNDLFPLAAELGGGDFRVVCPHAPVRAVTLNGGQHMRAWYDIVGLDLADRQDRNGATESAALIEQLLAAEYANGFRSENIFLAGFSQGAAMALHVGLHCQQRLAGIIALSGYLLFADSLPDSISEANRQTPIFQAHGSLDPVVLPQWGHATRDWLQEQKYPLEYHEYMMPHAIVPEEIDAINSWCEKQC